MNRAKGVTLIELMVTIVVLAILASLAIPSFQAMIEKRRLITAAEAIYSDLQFARSEALKRSHDMKVTLDPKEGNDWCLSVTDADLEVGAEDPKEVCGYPDQNIKMDTVGYSFIFSGERGTPKSGVLPSIVLISPSGYTLHVVVAPYVGRIKICSPSSPIKMTGYPPC